MSETNNRKVYILKNTRTNRVANVVATCRTDARAYVVAKKGWAEEDVTLKTVKPILHPMETGGDPYEIL